MSSDPNWPSRYSHPTRAAKRANLAEKVAWALKDAQAEIDSLTVLLGQAQKDRDEFASAEDRERTRAECALVALAAAESRAARLLTAMREIESKTGHFGEAPPPPEWMPMLSLIAWVGRTARAAIAAEEGK